MLAHTHVYMHAGMHAGMHACRHACRCMHANACEHMHVELCMDRSLDAATMGLRRGDPPHEDEPNRATSASDCDSSAGSMPVPADALPTRSALQSNQFPFLDLQTAQALQGGWAAHAVVFSSLVRAVHERRPSRVRAEPEQGSSGALGARAAPEHRSSGLLPGKASSSPHPAGSALPRMPFLADSRTLTQPNYRRTAPIELQRLSVGDIVRRHLQ